MSKDVVSKRYAVALFELATEQNKLDQIEQEMRVLKETFTANESLQQFLSHPKISSDKKKAMLQEAVGSKFTKESINTLFVLVDRGREEILSNMIDEFIVLANEKRGTAEAIVTSVRALSDDEKKSLSEVFAKKVGSHTLRITNVIDKDIIGGIKIQIGNRIFDGSVSGKLNRIQRQLVSVKG
jgi:F-type H+-transporting ATPase subunit delta